MGGKFLNILFVSGDSSDYLSASLLHGFRQLSNVNVIDYPKADFLYKKNETLLRSHLRGNGFTLYFLLDEVPQKRVNLKFNKIFNQDYDLIIFCDIKSNFGLYFEYFKYLNVTKTAVIDGSDSPDLFGNSGDFWRYPIYWFIPKPQWRFLYFKREWIPLEINYSRCFKLIPRWIIKHLPQSHMLRQISFSIPEEKIITQLNTKIKLFGSHIVDDEIRLRITGNGDGSYIFESEKDYYNDLQASRYGITTKRAGWDCLRHYEIAANGAVICFRDLDMKPKQCAPHGLIPGVNCLSYKNYDHLMFQINEILEDQYLKIQSNSLKWINENTTKNSAKKLISYFLQ